MLCSRSLYTLHVPAGVIEVFFLNACDRELMNDESAIGDAVSEANTFVLAQDFCPMVTVSVLDSVIVFTAESCPFQMCHHFLALVVEVIAC